jgi:putative DNA primase/helicase
MSPQLLLESGLALVPIPPKSKGPIAKGWNLRNNVITSAGHLDRLRLGNIGLAHAYCSPAPTCALDIDSYPQAKVWLKRQGCELTSLLEATDAVAIWSGKELSLKLLYRLPEGSPPRVTRVVREKLETEGQSDKMGEFGGGDKTILEFRCASADGLTVQDVLPPSIHPSGTQYQWLGSGSPLKLPTVPEVLLGIWDSLDERRPIPRHRAKTGGSLASPRALACLQHQLLHISADCNRNTWRDVVWGILSTGWDCAIDVARAWSLTAPNRFEEVAFDELVRDYDPSVEPSPTLGTVHHHAKAGGWHE